MKVDETIKVVLLRRVPKLGSKGAVVNANAGWVRKNLFPKGMVAYATPEMVERHSMSISERQQLEDPQELERRRLNKLIGALTTARIQIPRRIDWRTVKEGKEEMIGAVTAWDVVEATRRQYGISLDTSHLIMKESISQFGHFKIPLNLRTNEDRQVELSVIVQRVRWINHGHQYV
jgi:ribosomal protein L9